MATFRLEGVVEGGIPLAIAWGYSELIALSARHRRVSQGEEVGSLLPLRSNSPLEHLDWVSSPGRCDPPHLMDRGFSSLGQG